MSASPLRSEPDATASVAPGTVLPTACDAVGVLVDRDERRLVARRMIRAGERICLLVGRETRIPTRYSVQVGPEMHLDSDDLPDDASRVRERYWMYLNHSCEPSAWIRGLELVARRDIPAGSDVTFDYNATEWDMAEPFTCRCGSASCVGTVQGYRHLTPAQRVRLTPYLSPYLRSA